MPVKPAFLTPPILTGWIYHPNQCCLWHSCYSTGGSHLEMGKNIRIMPGPHQCNQSSFGISSMLLSELYPIPSRSTKTPTNIIPSTNTTKKNMTLHTPGTVKHHEFNYATLHSFAKKQRNTLFFAHSSNSRASFLAFGSPGSALSVDSIWLFARKMKAADGGDLSFIFWLRQFGGKIVCISMIINVWLKK